MQHSKSFYQEQVDSLKGMMNQTTGYMQSLQDELNVTKNSLEKANKAISDSATYASYIQQKLCPNDELLSKFFSGRTCFIKQKDIVGGDMIYAAERQSKIVFGLFDCTGHGIPGALISMMGFTFINEVVMQSENLDPAQILESINVKMGNFLLNSTQKKRTFDGMDGLMCVYDPEERTLDYSLAGRPLWVFKDSEWSYNTSAHGGIGTYMDLAYDSKKLSLQDGDQLFMFSDGLSDQFGGKNDKKFSRKRLRKILEDQASGDFKAKNKALTTGFAEWQGSTKQTDDISYLYLQL